VEGGNEDDEAGVFEEEGDDDVGKNLGAIFDNAKEMEHRRRPPLALARPVTAPTSLIANVVQKASPKKRKGMAVSSPLNPHTKRLRSNSGQVGAPHNGRKFPPRWRRHRKEARPAPKGSHAGPQDSCLHKEEQ